MTRSFSSRRQHHLNPIAPRVPASLASWLKAAAKSPRENGLQGPRTVRSPSPLPFPSPQPFKTHSLDVPKTASFKSLYQKHSGDEHFFSSP